MLLSNGDHFTGFVTVSGCPFENLRFAFVCQFLLGIIDANTNVVVRPFLVYLPCFAHTQVLHQAACPCAFLSPFHDLVDLRLPPFWTEMLLIQMTLWPCLLICFERMHSVVSFLILVHGSCSLKGAEYGTKPRVQLGLQYEGKVNVLGKQLGKVKPGAGAWKGAFECICELEIHLGGCTL